MRRVNVDRMRRHQRRRRDDLLRFSMGGVPVEFTVERGRDGGATIHPVGACGISVYVSDAQLADLRRISA